jgi:N-acetylglucosamine-6-phosphate deacetylase
MPSSATRPAVGGDVPLFAVSGRTLLGGEFVPATIVVKDGTIAEIRRDNSGTLPMPAYSADIVSPGFVDLQVNGGFGAEVGEDPAALRQLAAQLPSTGVTSYLPTCVSSVEPFYRKAVDAFEKGHEVPGAQALGMHLEGPLLSLKRVGAHSPTVIENAKTDVYDAVLGSGRVKLVTLAPERPGILPLIERLARAGVVVSLGHTEATYEEFIAGLDRGARMATHLYSAMSAFKHRAPGAPGAALTDPRVAVGIIADGVHCHGATIEIALRCKGWERVVLVTDMIAGAGMKPGEYDFDGRKVIVDERKATLPDGTLAGSVLLMDQAVRNVVEMTSATPAEALRMASEVPSDLMGWRHKGRIVVGADADLVLLDAGLHVQATFVGGRCFFSAPTR